MPKSVAEIQKRVKAYADAHPEEKWILGMGWTYPTFGPSALPDKKFLDEVVPDRPVFLRAFDGHSSWANSKALAMAGITRDTPILRTAGSCATPRAKPRERFKEAADDLIAKLTARTDPEERLAALRLGMREANKFGLVRVHSAGGDFRIARSL